jgi:hypothetical protein
VGGGDGRNRQRADTHTQRLRGLPNPHRQPAPVRREPADDHPAAGAIGARRPDAAEEQQRTQRDVVGRGGRGAPGRQHQQRTADQHFAFADPVDQVTPRDQGAHQTDGGHGHEQAGGRQRHAAIGQRGQQERDAVDEDRAGGLGEHAETEHRPAPNLVDLRNGRHRPTSNLIIRDQIPTL